MTAAELARLLSSPRYRHTQDELRLQDEIAAFLTLSSISHRREVLLSKADRVDFLVGTIGVEVKVKGSRHAVISQLLRYAAHEAVTELVLFTTRSQLVMPRSLGEKPVVVVRYTVF